MQKANGQESTVVSFQAGLAAQGTARARALVDQSRLITIKFLPSLLQRMLDNADDTLFELADKADNNLEQNAFFDAMRELRKERQVIEDVFSFQLREAFADFFTAPKSTQPVPGDGEVDLDAIGLVDDVELEESLAVNGMAAKAKSRYPRELYAIEHRFDAIVSDFSVDIDHVPVGPKRICQAFDEAANGLDVDTKIKLIIYKLFDKFVLSHLKPLFDEINALFIAAGILSSLKMTVKKQPELGRPTVRAPQDLSWLDNDSVTPTQQSLDAGAGLSQESADNSVLATLQQLLSSQLPANTFQPEHGHLGSAGVMQALSNLQVRHLDMSAAMPVDQLRASLSNEMSTLKSGGDFTAFDRDIIDIVGMLFDFILDDENLPSMAKACLARLQIPMLKVAMLDKDFFSSKQHSARQLLNKMAKSAVGLAEGVNGDNCPLIGKIEEIVDRVLSEFKDDASIFTELLDEFDTYFQQETEREEAAQKADLERLRKREKQTLTHAWVTDIIASRIKDKELPKPVYELIEGPWKEVMINTYLNEGENSKHWKENMRFMDVLMWSIEPKDDSVDKKRLGNVIQQLVGTLRDELKNVYFPPAKLDVILRDLEAFHMASLRGEQTITPIVNVRVKADSAGSETPESPESSEDIARELDAMRDSLADLDDVDALLGDVLEDINPDQVASSNGAADGDGNGDNVEEIVMSTTGLKSKTSPEIDDEYWQMVLTLNTGQWINLIDSNGRTQRIKLAWKSDVVGECTFINWKFKIAADFTFNQLAARFRCGKATLIESLPLFERAFDSVMNRLQKSSPQPA